MIETRLRIAATVLGVATLGLFGAATLAEVPPRLPAPVAEQADFDALWRRLQRDRPEVLVVHGASAAIAARAESWAGGLPLHGSDTRDGLHPEMVAALYDGRSEGWRAAGRGPFPVRVLPASRVEMEDLRDTDALLVGHPRQHPLLRELAPSLGIEVSAEGFRFQGRDWNGPEDVLWLRARNPLTPDHVLLVATGNSPESIADSVYRSLGNRDFEVRRRGLRWTWGTLEDGRADRPAIDLVDVDAILSGQTTLEGLRARHAPGVDDRRLADFAAASRRARERAARLLEDESPKDAPTRVLLLPSLELLAEVTGSPRIAQLDADGRLLTTLDADLWRWSPRPEVLPPMRSEPERIPAVPLLEAGLAVAANPDWGRLGHDELLGRLIAAGMRPSLTELLAPGALEYGSLFAKEAFGATLLEWLAQGHPAGTGSNTGTDWPGWLMTGRVPGAIEDAWQDRLRSLARTVDSSTPPERALPERIEGFNVTNESFAIAHGYLSRTVEPALERLAKLGANTVALIPYTYMFDITRPLPLSQLRGATKENDQGILRSARVARQLGLAVVLKPQLQGGGWPGYIRMEDPDDWRVFLDRYEEWILHHALVAEMIGAEGLVLGTELVEATRVHPDRWRRMATNARRVFRGELLYAANWGEELERLEFWDAFDALGVDAYYPLTDQDEPDPGVLRAGARAMAERVGAVARRWNMPVVFTEIGLASVPSPWREPWSGGGREVDLEAQRRGIEALIAALDDRPWLRGTLWWKWPTSLAYGGPADTDFLLSGKPAAEPIGRWFRKDR